MVDISGYEGLYAITSCGKVWSYKRKKFLKNCLDPITGYYQVCLYKDGGKHHATHLVHRLVANAYLPNPNDYPCINHKDENKAHNNINNLEWCNHEYNNNYGTRNSRISKSFEKYKRPVKCLNTGECFDSQTEAAKHFGLHSSAIQHVASGKAKHTAGYKFIYI